MIVDVERYLEIPYLDQGRSEAGCDCWGLCWLVYGHNGIAIPSYAEEYASAHELDEVARIVHQEMDGPRWEAIASPEIGDVVSAWYSRRGKATHVGVIAAAGQMLHMREGQAPATASLSDPFWKSRVMGIYRWRH